MKKTIALWMLLAPAMDLLGRIWPNPPPSANLLP